jgi:hypothetical protein
MIPLPLFFMLKNTLAIWGLLWLLTNFSRAFSISVENVIGILIGIALIAFSSMDILILLSLLIHEHSVSFHLFASSTFFFSVL